ncbi:unnamed protein product [Euphydryas editha]|uniref:Retrotransposon gag domain-containing protein n=1 Tax=Euphydryas editha TaxID=104508 RepID=A0AAU9VES9_EUPED|nr:unnamed protein product [Euphydryas editha]
MESFNYRTAVALLPVMNGDENVTKSLIDAIELYSSSLTKEGKEMLIKFILKTRLHENAKLRMSTLYDSCDSLIRDMRHHLLTKKSNTAIHKELSSISQNGLTVDKYGSKVEQLFVDLTVTQADGDQNAYKILRPQNEKNAIKSFIDGLRNREIRTILSARNYDTLKDTIRAAQDEELSYNRPHSHDMAYVGYQDYSYNNRGNHRRFNNGRSNHSGASLSVLKYNTVARWNIPIQKECISINGIGGKVQTMGYVFITLTING